MKYAPQYTITPRLISILENIAALKTKIESSAVSVAWIPSFKKESFLRMTHSSTAIEGNPLTLKEVRALAEGRSLPQARPRHIREVLNYLVALRYIERRSSVKKITERDVLRLHAIIGEDALEREPVGAYRPYQVYVGLHTPPSARNISTLMKKLLNWLNDDGQRLPPVISSAILHYQFEYIHPFGDGNGRVGRALATWEMYRRKFDTYHIFAVDEIFWENQDKYYEALAKVAKQKGDLSDWLEFVAGAIEETLQRVWKRIAVVGRRGKNKQVALTPKQERLLLLLRDAPLAISEIQSELKVTKQGAHFILKPLLDNRMVKRIGGYKTGRYVLC